MRKTSQDKFWSKKKRRIANTTDMWTANNQKKGYMIVTTHFMDDCWDLYSRILSFKYIPHPRNADTLFDALAECLVE